MSYPQGGIESLLQSPLVTEATRAVLAGRLSAAPPPPPDFFGEVAHRTLVAACARLLPPDSPLSAEAAAAGIAKKLAANRGDGWRFDVLPSDAETFRGMLRGLDEAAALDPDAPANNFADLAPARQDAVLKTVSEGNAPGTTWKTLPAQRCFEELFGVLAELYASHPTRARNDGLHRFRRRGRLASPRPQRTRGLGKIRRPHARQTPRPNPAHRPPSQTAGRAPLRHGRNGRRRRHRHRRGWRTAPLAARFQGPQSGRP